jgi:phage terminase small subunit
VDVVRKGKVAPSSAPGWLSPEATEIYHRTAALKPEADPDLVAVYASALAEHNRAAELLTRSGPLIQGANGLVRNPLTSVKQANAGTVRQLAKALGLGSEPPEVRPRARRYRNRQATEATISALRMLGRIEPVDESAIALSRTLAIAIDSLEPDDPALASLARTQLQALRMLRGQTDDSANALAALLASVSTAVGDAPES